MAIVLTSRGHFPTVEFRIADTFTDSLVPLTSNSASKSMISLGAWFFSEVVARRSGVYSADTEPINSHPHDTDTAGMIGDASGRSRPGSTPMNVQARFRHRRWLIAIAMVWIVQPGVVQGQGPGPRGPGMLNVRRILTHIPSSVGGESGIAVGLIVPPRPRYATGAPVLIHVPGGIVTGETEGPPGYAGA